MKIATPLCAAVVSLCLASVTFGQLVTEKSDAASIVKQLTSQPRDTWISAGTIQATHYAYGAPKITDSTTIQSAIDAAVTEYLQDTQRRELTPEFQQLKLAAIPFNVKYKLANEYVMTSREVVKYDGNRFYWEINVTSRQDSIQPELALTSSNAMTEEFNMSWNRQRIFAWDGQKYTTYSVSGGQAVVDAAGRLPRGVNGPLTAGLIPWGKGRFSSESLSAAKVTMNQTTFINKTGVPMTIDFPDGLTAELTLDPGKNYAVMSAKFTSASGFVVSYSYSGYQVYAGRWVPSTIIIQRKGDRLESRVPTAEQWTFTYISTSLPSLSNFKVSPELDTVVEYVSPVTASSEIYTNSFDVDTDELLSERLAYVATRRSQAHNCATVALRHIASAFGKSTPESVLAKLVGTDGGTNLYDLKQSAQDVGLYGRVVKTDLAGLENLGTAKAILHIPGRNHFVVLDRVDKTNVWLIDLSNRNFYYARSVRSFPLDWSEGTALLLSEEPVVAQIPELPDAMLKTIAGGTTAKACNTIIQEEEWIGCDYIPMELCAGAISWYRERWGCGDATAGTCTWRQFVFRQQMACIPDPIYDCVYSGEWHYQVNYACN